MCEAPRIECLRVLKIKIPNQQVRRHQDLCVSHFLDCDASLGRHGDERARHGCLLYCGSSMEQDCGVAYATTQLQSTVALSTTEAELTAISWAAKRYLGVVNTLREVLPHARIQKPIIYGDNKAANLLASCRTSIRNHRHLMLPQLYVRILTQENKLEIEYKATHLNTADILTKVVTGGDLSKKMKLIGYDG